MNGKLTRDKIVILILGCSNTSSLSFSYIDVKEADTCLQDKKGHRHVFRWQIYLKHAVILQKESARESDNRALNHNHMSVKTSKQNEKGSLKSSVVTSFHAKWFYLFFWERLSRYWVFSHTNMALKLQWEYPSSGKDEFIWSHLIRSAFRTNA